MKHFDGQYYVKVKDLRYKTHPTENISLRLRDPPKSLGTQYQIQNNTQIRKNQKVFEKNYDSTRINQETTNYSTIRMETTKLSFPQTKCLVRN